MGWYEAGHRTHAARSRSLKYDVTLKTLLMNCAPALLTQLAGHLHHSVDYPLGHSVSLRCVG